MLWLYNYQRISRKYPTAAFHLRNNRLGICRFDAELDTGIAMKPPSFAPVYAVFFPVLAEIAQANGYALTVHGSLQKDFDLLAAPWTIEAVSAEDLMKGIADYAGQVMGMMFETSVVITQVEEKPHGRKAWCIKMGNGSVIDLSVMPRLSV